MKKTLIAMVPALLLAILGGLLADELNDAAPSAQQRAGLKKTMQAGNFKDAYDGFRQMALDRRDDPKLVGQDMNDAIQCLRRLNRVDEIDAFREAVIKAHPQNWRLLWAAARSYMSIEHYGYMISGEFQRGRHRGGGQVVNAMERDRVRALQLMREAMALVTNEPSRDEVARLYLSLADTLMGHRHSNAAWQLQHLSDIESLPDYEPGWGHQGGPTAGAPVLADGSPVYYPAPRSWDEATNDGQRWRYALAEALEWSPPRLNAVRMQLARFYHSQFGVQTMADYGFFFHGQMQDEDREDESGTYALHTLGEGETIAKLATGIKRFELPDEFNPIKIYQQIAQDDQTGYGQQALAELAEIFTNRRQYPQAAAIWRKNIEKYGKSNHKQQRLQQIVGNWGQFEPIMTQPAGQGASVEFRFRNGAQLALTAHSIDIKKLLADVKAYLKSNPQKLDWQKIDIGNIGYRLVHENQKQYLRKRVAAWDLELKPRENHFDKRITLTTPLQEPGAYLLTAKMHDGNTSKIIVWVSDTAIVKKPMAGKIHYFVADAVSGTPVAKANIEWFGFRQTHTEKNRYQVHTRNFAEHTDKTGQVIQSVHEQLNNYQWIVTATTPGGRLAYLGFTGLWHAHYHDGRYDQVKTYSITDRPVYRPAQKVQFKCWVRRARYDQEEKSEFAGQTFNVEIHDPKGEKVFTQSLASDAYGGIEGTYELPADATLGVYQLHVVGRGGGHFRVEEYKKPEFEVTVEAPGEPVRLGEIITATIQAKYYFGSPVTGAKVKYKVLRTNHNQQWYPPTPWDWLYGRGSWWFGYDYRWYPGWESWGCLRPMPPWWQSHTPPELVAERETTIGRDGTLQVEIDTSLAAAIHPDQDHSYQIVAEVVDASRRTIVGEGRVLVARKPFKVFTWVDRGYYRVNDVIRASFAARRLDEKPVKGSGKVTLLAIQYDPQGQPKESPVGEWNIDTDAQGLAELKIKATTKGQYRIVYRLTDANDHAIEGGYVFTIVGEGFDGSEFRFDDIELIPDQREYKAGETVKLQVNTNRVGSTVLLFVRPVGGVYLPPQTLQLDGKSTVVEIGVTQKDMPNFFVEAVTVARGQVFETTRELYVPPESRVLGVEVVTSAETYKPGQRAQVKLKLTDETGEPFAGSTVLAIYDKSVEYISGGSNVPEIKEFFWKWRRDHRSQMETNLARYFDNMTLPKKPGMADLGIFGRTVADELRDDDGAFGNRGKSMRSDRFRRLGAGGGGLGGGPGRPMARAAVPMEAMESMAAGDELSAQAGADAAPPLVEPTVRSEFADTALWKGSVTTGSDGLAEVELEMPENLTTWKVKVWGMGHGTRVGQGEAEVVTRKELIVRMQAPRFFIQKDEVVLSANVHNYLDQAKQVQVTLELDGTMLKPMGDATQSVTVNEKGEARVDWRVKVVDEGQAVVRMKALTDEESDAMQMSFPVYVHGMLKMDSFSGVIRPDASSGKFTVEVPSQRRPEATRLEVRYSPTLAGAMVDALPYLVEYPYGCTEQTLNRFLPTVITQKILLEMGLDLADIEKKRTNLNAQEIGDDLQRAEGWKRYKRNPVFDEAEVEKMVKKGVRDLTEMQLADGGWGWFSGYAERSYPHTTAVVVHGLQTAQQNDVALVPGTLERGVQWLTQYQDEQVRKLKNAPTETEPYKRFADNIDGFVYMVLVDAGVQNAEMMELLYRDRTKLAVYTKAMFGMALKKLDEADKLAMILRNIEQYLVQDNENQTAYLNLAEGSWWYWYGSEYEAHAYYLKLLAATDPQSETASRLVKYLLNNRKHASYWNSTRDTSIVIEAMADYLKATGEHKPEMVVEVWLDGEKQKEVQITADNLFTFDNKLVLSGEAVQSGVHTVELRRRGAGPLYYNGYVTNFTLEDHITRAGLELQVDRKYYKLVREEKQVQVPGSRGQVIDQAVEKYERIELPNLCTLESGDLVEVELTIESKNDYEYVIFEDMKPAGFEPVAVRSGYNGNALGAYMELRDNRVALFVRHLARGKHSVSYRMRAEIPGCFSALPTRAHAMYAPELKGNSDELKLNIEDPPSVALRETVPTD